MQRHRVLIIFGIAWLSALLLSWWVYTKSTSPQAQRDVVNVVVAARELPVGSRLQAEDLKLIALERKDLPKEAFLKSADLVDRSLAVPVAAGEILLSRKISTKGSGEGLTALIEPGMRAISVQINEVSGVSGFIQPGTHVDVLFTRVFNNGDAATTTILHNVKVLAYGKRLDSGVALDPRDTTKPTAATLLVTQEQAEKLVLAGQRGRIQLVLRNSLDAEVAEPADPTRPADLGIEEPQKPVPAPVKARIPAANPGDSQAPPGEAVAPPPVAAKKPKPEKPGLVVRIFRGDKVTEIRFE